MIRQDFTINVTSQKLPAFGRKIIPVKEKTHVWEVRHAGLLGIKYEVAVRSDLVKPDQIKAEFEDIQYDSRAILKDVVDAAVLGYVSSPIRRNLVNLFNSLGDRDDDVRSVAASCLLPVAQHLVTQLPEELGRVLAVLWSCLSDMKDDLSSSVGAVMDLLGKFFSM